MKRRRIELFVFLTSATLLAFLYGYGARAFGWFPDPLLERSLQQTVSFLAPPRYLGPLIHGDQGVRVPQANRVSPGLTLVATHDQTWDWQPGLKLIDSVGRTIHEWTLNTSEVFGRSSGTYGVRTNDRNVHGAYLFSNGDVLASIEYTGIVRLDACGNVKWLLANRAHHSISRDADGTFWAPITSSAAVPKSDRYPTGYPGLARPINHDRLLRFTEHGVPVDTVSVLDVLFENDLVRHLAKARVPQPYPTDLTHVNDVEPLSPAMADDYPLFEAGDLLVSIRTASLVLVFDPGSAKVKWYLSDPFVEQHDPDFIGGGWVGVYDNARDGTERGSLLGGSRILTVQPHTDSVRTLFPGPDSDPFYSSFLGKWQLLENGNILLTEGRAGRVVEVDAEGSTVWEWIERPYEDGAHAVEVTEGTRYPLTVDDVAEWPCSLLDETGHG